MFTVSADVAQLQKNNNRFKMIQIGLCPWRQDMALEQVILR